MVWLEEEFVWLVARMIRRLIRLLNEYAKKIRVLNRLVIVGLHPAFIQVVFAYGIIN